MLKGYLARLPVAFHRALHERRWHEEHERVRTALAEIEQRNRQLVEESVYEVFRVSIDGKFECANASLLQMLACPSLEDLQALNLASDIFRYPEHYVKFMAACRDQGLVQSAETEWRLRMEA